MQWFNLNPGILVLQVSGTIQHKEIRNWVCFFFQFEFLSFEILKLESNAKSWPCAGLTSISNSNNNNNVNQKQKDNLEQLVIRGGIKRVHSWGSSSKA